jgi:CRISPR/Cas system-associated exonuclease Cas4 (RecB family)
MYGTRPAKAVLHFLETGERGVIEPSDTDMSVVRTVVTSTAAKIREREFQAAPVKGVKTCQQCAYHQICPSSLTVR